MVLEAALRAICGQRVEDTSLSSSAKKAGKAEGGGMCAPCIHAMPIRLHRSSAAKFCGCCCCGLASSPSRSGVGVRRAPGVGRRVRRACRPTAARSMLSGKMQSTLQKGMVPP